MIYYFIISIFTIITINSQEIDEVVDCNYKDLSQYQLDKMTLYEQEQLVNKL